MNKNKVFIVGGGPSLLGFDFTRLQNHDTIVINKALSRVARVNYFITMDYLFLRKIGEEGVRELKRTQTHKVFVANFAGGDLIYTADGLIRDHRCKMTYDRLSEIFDEVIISRKYGGIGLTTDDFRNGRNSGYCAMQLAVTLGYTEIYLLGFDMQVQNQRTHFHQGYNQPADYFSKVLNEYYELFEIGLTEIKKHNIKVYSCSLFSRLNNFIEYKDVEAGLVDD
tara:strand:+ start:518 stop:1189 length:672 start_codon:yes stop_codon:yes gene_type:complete